MQTALQHHAQGRLPEAEAGYRAVLAAHPQHLDALHLLGVCLTQAGRGAEALAPLHQAAQLAPAIAGA